MSTSTPVWALLTVSAMAAVATILVALLTMREQRRRLSAELEFQRLKFAAELAAQHAQLTIDHTTEVSVETALKYFLSLSELRYRTFSKIRHHIGGFAPNELRQLLVRAGAVRFMAADGTELWGLISRVELDFKYSRWKHPESPLQKIPDNELFPAAFGNPEHF